MAKCTFLGLGVMGFPMAAHLVKAGHDVTVYNRTTDKARAWADSNKAKFAATPREAADGAEFVFACVGNDDDLRSVCLGEDGAFVHGQVYVALSRCKTIDALKLQFPLRSEDIILHQSVLQFYMEYMPDAL